MNKSSKVGKVCCNPFSKHGIQKRENLSVVSKLLITLYPDKIKEKDFICSSCKRRCHRERGKKAVVNLQKTCDDFNVDSINDLEHSLDPNSSQESTVDEISVQADESFKEHDDHKKERILSLVNTLLQEFDKFPMNSIDTSVPERAEQKLDFLVKRLKYLLIENYKPDTSKSEFEEIIVLLQNKFKTLSANDDKIQLLTILPPSWAASTISNKIGCSIYLAEEAKKLQIDNGIFSRPKSTK